MPKFSWPTQKEVHALFYFIVFLFYLLYFNLSFVGFLLKRGREGRREKKSEREREGEKERE